MPEATTPPSEPSIERIIQILRDVANGKRQRLIVTIDQASAIFLLKAMKEEV